MDSIMHSNIKEILDMFSVAFSIQNHASDLLNMNEKKYAEMFTVPLVGFKKAGKSAAVSYLDNLQKTLQDTFFVMMVGEFEKIVFQKLANALGEAKNTVIAGYPAKMPLQRLRGEFVRTAENIANLNGVCELCKGKISKENSDRLSNIVSHRNHLAHGKRFGKAWALADVKSLAIYLDDILSEIDRN
jgi:hypothetical protein